MSDHGTWWEPTEAGIRAALENGDFGYDVAPTVRLLIDLLDEARSSQERETPKPWPKEDEDELDLRY